MTRRWTDHPLVVIALLVLAVLVWGTFLLKVRADHTAGLQPVEPLASGPLLSDAPPEIPYPTSLRDPFSPILADALATEMADHSLEHRPAAIRHSLHGIIGGSAIVLDPGGSSHIVRAGDTLDDIEIASVNADHVVVRRNGHSHQIGLHR